MLAAISALLGGLIGGPISHSITVSFVEGASIGRSLWQVHLAQLELDLTELSSLSEGQVVKDFRGYGLDDRR